MTFDWKPYNDEIRSRIQAGETPAEIRNAMDLQIEPERFRKKIQFEQNRLKKEQGGGTGSPVYEVDLRKKPIFWDKKKDDLSLWDMLDDAESQVERKRRLSRYQHEAVIELSHTCAIMFSSDWHLGSPNVNYPKFREDLRYLIETPDLYCGLVGDLLDLYLRFKTIAPILNQIWSSEEQTAILEKIIEAITPKLLFSCWGNHDTMREEKELGYSPSARLIAKEVPFFPGKGLVRLLVGEQEYILWATHQTRFNSYLNAHHGAAQEKRNYMPTADVVVSGHIHAPTFLYSTNLSAGKRDEPFNNVPAWISIVTGSYKGQDIYSQRFFEAGRIGCPTIVFHAEEKKMIPFFDPREAMIYMRGLS